MDSNSENNKEERQKVEITAIENEMQSSYMSYAMSVIVGRALPDVRDGLKPVHRRILYAMYDMSITHNKPHKKSARIVGEVLGKYHPHGDSAVYDAMVRMAQLFSLRYPMVDGHGNFGSIDGDSAAAMRYTEARMTKISEEMLEDIKKETVDMTANFDDSLKEPSVLPAKIPSLLLNGSSGIAVGMATNIPPHNLKEVCNSVIEVINNPECPVTDLMEIITGPDFPTAGIITGKSGIRKAYTGGRGIITVKARMDAEAYKNKERIIITEIPYGINKSLLLEEIAGQIKEKKIEGISDLRDESDRNGMRVVVELKRDANAEVVMNQLYKHSRLKVSYGINMLALVNSEPVTLNLKQAIEEFIKHREEVITRRCQYDLQKAKDKIHVLEGLIIALDNIDSVVEKIKKSKSVQEAQEVLMADYGLSDKQAKAILDMRLQKLSSLEQEKIRDDHKKTLELIKELEAILADRNRVLEIIKDEQRALIENYGDERKTQISMEDDDDLDIEDLIPEEDMVVTISHSGYIKRTPIDTYKEQKRGGKGIIASGTKEDDFLEKMFIANTHDYILFFSDKGKVYWLKVYKIPEASRQSKGNAIVNLIELEKDEKVTAFIPIKQFDDEHFLFMITRKGVVKKTQLSAFSRPRKTGINAISIDEGDKLIDVKLTNGKKNLILATRNGMAIRFGEDNVRSMGRNARGVAGIKLKGDDKVIGGVIASKEKAIFTITENGFGKRTSVSEYRHINRGGSGVRNIVCDERNGKVVSVKGVTDEDGLMVISKTGIMIRISVKDISLIGRNTKGVRIMRLKGEDSVVALAKALTGDTEEAETFNGVDNKQEDEFTES